jgi:hypothetical protein
VTAVFGLACALLLTSAGLSMTIRVSGRPRRRALEVAPHPIGGGR